MGKTDRRVRFHTGNMSVSFFKFDMLAFQDGALTGRMENGLGGVELVIGQDGSRDEVEEPV